MSDTNLNDASFTPEIQDSEESTNKQTYSATGSFRFWCQKVLPLVYDDSLSYYELLCKVVNYLNSVIQNVDNLNTSVDNTNTAFNNLQNYVNTTKDTLVEVYDKLEQYVNDYFNNLDVQEEINSKLDSMAEDGSLSTIISPFIPTAVSEWLSHNITPTTPAIDASLSISGAGADAKVTGDRLSTTLQKFDHVINDAWLTENNISDVKQLTKNRVYLLTNVTKANLTSMPTTTGTSYNGGLVIFDEITPGMTPLLFIDNVGKLYSGVDIGTSIRWIENATIGNISSLTSSIQSLENTSLRTFDYAINDSWLTTNNISDVKQLTKNKVYLLTNVTKANLTSMPTTTSTSYNGGLIIFDEATQGMSPLLFIDNVGKLYSGVDIGTSIRWIENATSGNISSLISAIQSLENTSFRTFGTPITDSWLNTNNIDDVRKLTVNYCYIINNVTKDNLTNMPEISVKAYNGALLYFKQQSPAFQPLFFIDNVGKCWSGIDTGTTIRWKSLTQVYESINDALYRFYNKKILILGDSIVYGSHMSDFQEGDRTIVTLEDDTVYKNNLSTTVWSYKFAQYITENYGMTVVNNAYAGARFQDLITYYDQLVNDTYDFVLICMGVNNWNSGGQVIPTLTTLKNRFDAMGAKMLVLTPLGSTTYASTMGLIRGFIKEWGLNVNKEIGDLYSNFNEINYLKGHSLSDVLLDGVHYNDASQTDIYEAVKKTLNL